MVVEKNKKSPKDFLNTLKLYGIYNVAILATGAKAEEKYAWEICLKVCENVMLCFEGCQRDIFTNHVVYIDRLGNETKRSLPI